MPSIEAIRIFAPAKINLFLHVGDKRADGYHAIQSLVAFADVGDELAIEQGEGLSLSIKGPFASALEGEADNLVLKAARALAKRADIAPNAKITLIKNLPVASGIGGGSSDAAATLRGLCKLWNVDITATDLHAIAVSIGADVPVCLNGRPCWVEGIGEKLTVVPIFPTLHGVVVNPGVSLSTARVFSGLQARTGTTRAHPAAFADANALIGFLKSMGNDLEEPATKCAPAICEATGALCSHEPTLLARMSGSGATCFGLYGSGQTAHEIADGIASAHQGWWVKAVRLGNG